MVENKVKFEAIADEIEHKIRKKIYVSSQKLPSEYDLAKEFDCSRLTVRKAIDLLIKKNIIFKQPGKGNYVMTQEKIQSGRAGLQGFTEAAKNYGKQSQTKVISFVKVAELDDEISRDLQLTDDKKVYELVRVRELDNEPMTVEKIYLNEELVAGYQKKDFQHSLFDLIEQKIDIAYSHQEIEAILVDEEISQLLDVAVGQPLLKVRSITYAADATPIFYDISFYRADRYTFKNVLNRYNH